jgi:hypothetical protein
MQQIYYETRHLPTNPPATLAADIARHLQKRQYLGRTIVVCENPLAIMSATRKQWVKASRYVQRLRASTLNAEEILRLTHALMHMQNMHFTIRPFVSHPDASAYFVTPDAVSSLPTTVNTVYITAPVTHAALKMLQKPISNEGLIVNYIPELDLKASGMHPKSELEATLRHNWDYLAAFLVEQDVDPAKLVIGNVLQFAAMDEALDILLGVSTEFLVRAASLQHSLNVSQPLTSISSEELKRYEAVTRLAHRVQALTPGNFNTYLSTTFGDSANDVFFLQDIGSELYIDLEIEAGGNPLGITTEVL